MTRFTNALVALVAWLCALALVPATGASASSGQSGLATHRTERIMQETLAPGGPRTWHVLVGGHADGQAVQAEGYYPHVIIIDAGDTVVWTLNTEEIHAVAFTGTCEDMSCIPPCVFTVDIDVSPLRVTQLRWCQRSRQFWQNGPLGIPLGQLYPPWKHDILAYLHEARRQRLFRPERCWNEGAGDRRSSGDSVPAHSGAVF